MAFYNTGGNEINKNQWIEKFEPYYYLDGPTYGQKIKRSNQTKRSIEQLIEQILTNGPINVDDIKTIIAWKLGKIDHINSTENNIIFKNNPFRDTWGNDLESAYNYITNNGQNLEKWNDLRGKEPENIFDVLITEAINHTHRKLTVYTLTLIYFLKHGGSPIYDKYAHIALDAIINGYIPGQPVQYRCINDWNQYCNYKQKIINVFGIQEISRSIDRSLWAYGHFFNNQGA